MAPVIDECPKCNGKRTRPRTKEEDGAEADSDIHPVISRTPKPCDRCGGSGRAVLTREEIQKNIQKSST